MYSTIFVPFFIFFSLSIILLPVKGSSSLQLDAQQGLGSILGLPTSYNLFLNAKRYRLPKTVIPTQYNLDIRPILDESDDFLSAPGFVRIQVNCVEETNVISLHSVDIGINKGDVQVLSMKTEESIPVADLSFDIETESLAIHLEDSLLAGKTYFIEISFMAKVAFDKLLGLYFSKYTTNFRGLPSYVVATQFEDLYARTAFPCFDEPALKANFSIRVGRQESFKSLSNTIITETLPIDNLPGWFWDVYQPTENMSTYLVAIIVMPDDYESEVAPGSLYDKPVAVWAPSHFIHSGAAVFAAQSSAKALSFFDNYFDFKYSFPKMDSIAVRHNFGAMENWGLNTYRPELLLYIEGESTQYHKYLISEVIAHEISHQWFGNLVTMDWWNGIWLIEGLASYFMFLGSAASDPQLNAMDRFANAVQLAMRYDGGPDTLPTQSNTTNVMVRFPENVIYERGASLIRMMEGFLTADTLQKGLQNYLKEKAYGSVIQDEMFHELTMQAHLDNTLPLNITVKEIMDPWTLQQGFPILRVNKLGSSRISLSQERFYHAPQLDHAPQNIMWRIPVSYVTKSNPDITSESLKPKLWIERNKFLISHAIKTDEWILINPDAMNYYRVLYDRHFESLLQEQLLNYHTLFSSSSRSELLDDYFKAAFARYINISRAMEFTKYLDKEMSLSVWTTVLENFRGVYYILMDTDLSGPFVKYFGSKVILPLLTIGMEETEEESPVVTSLRAILLDWCCSMEHEICILHAQSLFQKWITDPYINPIGADVRPMVYCAAVVSEDTNVSEFIVRRYNISSASGREAYYLLRAMACTKRKDLLISYLNMAIDPNSAISSSGFSASLINSIAQNSIGRKSTFFFVSMKYQEIIDHLGLSSLTNVISTLSQYFATDDLLLQMIKFKSYIEHILDDEAKTSFDESIQNIKANIKWKEVYYNEMENWLQPNI